MGLDKHMTIYSKIKENNYKKFAPQVFITFLSTIGKLSHDVKNTQEA
jgi:hypothetical protein